MSERGRMGAEMSNMDPVQNDLTSDVAPWRRRDAWILAGCLLAIEVVHTLPLAIVGPSIGAPALILRQAGWAAAIWYVFCLRKQRPIATLGLRKPDPLRMSLPRLVAVGLVLETLMVGVGVALTALFYDLVLGRPMPASSDVFSAVPGGASAAAMVWIAVIGAPVSEELLFRGVMFRWLRVRKGERLAAVISAAVFSAVHLEPHLLLARFGMGLVLAHTVEVSSSLYPAIALHAAMNALAVLSAIF